MSNNWPNFRPTILATAGQQSRQPASLAVAKPAAAAAVGQSAKFFRQVVNRRFDPRPTVRSPDAWDSAKYSEAKVCGTGSCESICAFKAVFCGSRAWQGVATPTGAWHKV